MNIELDTSTLSLPRDGLVAVRDAEGTRVTCVSGALWITEDHREGDVILEAGQAFTIGRPGLTLIMALSAASLQFAERRESLATRVGGWLTRVLPMAKPAVC
jgi:hypothetical protein